MYSEKYKAYRREYMQEWRKKNKDKIKRYNRIAYLKSKEELNILEAEELEQLIKGDD